MGSSLEDEYSVTCVAAKAGWYSPCVRRIGGGASAKSDGGIILWMVGWVCGKGFVGCEFVNGVQMRYCYGILIGQ